jgi:hypothetical protein
VQPAVALHYSFLYVDCFLRHRSRIAADAPLPHDPFLAVSDYRILFDVG